MPVVREAVVRRHRVRRFVLLPLAIVAVVVGGLLSYEMAHPRTTPVDYSNLLLHEQIVTKQFTVEVPVRWELFVNGGVARFVDPDVPETGMRVVPSKEPLVKIGKSSTLVDGRPAIKHDGAGNVRWWIERGKGTYQIDLYARADIREGRSVLYDRIITTFHEL